MEVEWRGMGGPYLRVQEEQPCWGVLLTVHWRRSEAMASHHLLGASSPASPSLPGIEGPGYPSGLQADHPNKGLSGGD